MKIENNLLINDANEPFRFIRSPNIGGSIIEHKFIIIHYTAGQSTEGAVEWLSDPTSEVSAHLVIGRDGQIVQLVTFNTIALHAGPSNWKGLSGLAPYSVGIELDNAGRMLRLGDKWMSAFRKEYPEEEVMTSAHKFKDKPYGWHIYPDAQVQATIDVCIALVQAYPTITEILGHDDISPKRKWDPGPAFPMDRVRASVFS